eukprot:766943-Hanusia_phi.AAC.3
MKAIEYYKRAASRGMTKSQVWEDEGQGQELAGSVEAGEREEEGAWMMAGVGRERKVKEQEIFQTKRRSWSCAEHLAVDACQHLRGRRGCATGDVSGGGARAWRRAGVETSAGRGGGE